MTLLFSTTQGTGNDSGMPGMDFDHFDGFQQESIAIERRDESEHSQVILPRLNELGQDSSNLSEIPSSNSNIEKKTSEKKLPSFSDLMSTVNPPTPVVRAMPRNNFSEFYPIRSISRFSKGSNQTQPFGIRSTLEVGEVSQPQRRFPPIRSISQYSRGMSSPIIRNEVERRIHFPNVSSQISSIISQRRILPPPNFQNQNISAQRSKQNFINSSLYSDVIPIELRRENFFYGGSIRFSFKQFGPAKQIGFSKDSDVPMEIYSFRGVVISYIKSERSGKIILLISPSVNTNQVYFVRYHGYNNKRRMVIGEKKIVCTEQRVKTGPDRFLKARVYTRDVGNEKHFSFRVEPDDSCKENTVPDELREKLEKLDWDRCRRECQTGYKILLRVQRLVYLEDNSSVNAPQIPNFVLPKYHQHHQQQQQMRGNNHHHHIGMFHNHPPPNVILPPPPPPGTNQHREIQAATMIPQFSQNRRILGLGRNNNRKKRKRENEIFQEKIKKKRKLD